MRSLHAATLCFGALSVFCFACLACLSLTPAQQREVGRTAAVIAKCQDLGRACKADGGTGCYEIYDACMKDGGL